MTPQSLQRGSPGGAALPGSIPQLFWSNAFLIASEDEPRLVAGGAEARHLPAAAPARRRGQSRAEVFGEYVSIW